VHIEKRMAGDVMVLSLVGDMTIDGSEAVMVADKVRSEMVQGQTRFVLDLGHVRYIDSAGLGELIHTFAAVRNRGGAMKLANITKRVNELLILTRLLTVFECFDSEADAIASFPAARAQGA
jgi:anti-sigma B factor antagonist